MALNKPTFIASIKTLLDTTFADTGNSQTARDNFANELADRIDAYIKSATITIPSGAVIVTGTAATQNNPEPIVLNNTIT